jgi:hypothetical protein
MSPLKSSCRDSQHCPSYVRLRSFSRRRTGFSTPYRRRRSNGRALGTAIERVGDHLVDGLGRKFATQVLRMAWLPASRALLAVLSRGLRRLDEIAEGRLERRGGVLFQSHNAPKQPSVLRFQFLNASLQRRNRFRNYRPNIILRENPAHTPFITSDSVSIFATNR